MTIMKKVYYFMLLAVMTVFATSLSSCSKDDDLPKVDVTLDVDQSTAKTIRDTVYVVRGETIIVNDVNITNLEQGKPALINKVSFYWDGVRLTSEKLSHPFYMLFPTLETTTLGNHKIGLTCQVAAEGKSLAFAVVDFPVKVVEDESEIPPVNSNDSVTIKNVQLVETE